ncbi:hypothetical protein NHF46_23310 [Arthrobacter alpinus]|nr:hypothetical protein [Arthrobacter alpinus]
MPLLVGVVMAGAASVSLMTSMEASVVSEVLKPFLVVAVTEKGPNLLGAFAVHLPSTPTGASVTTPSMVTVTVVPVGAPATVPVTAPSR